MELNEAFADTDLEPDFIEEDEVFFDLTKEAAIAERISKRIGRAVGDNIAGFWQDPKLGVPDSGISLEFEQAKCVRGVYDALKHGKTRLYAEAPTGWGKTVAVMKLQELLRDGQKPARTLVVCNDLNDMWRWEGEYEKLAPELGKKGIATNAYVGLYYGDEKNLRPVTITTYASFANAAREGIIGPDDFELIVLDEGHKSLSDLRKEVLGKMNSVQIALSATPAYSREKTLAAEYTCAYECSPERAEALGLISPFESVIIKQPHVTLDQSVVLDSGAYDKKKLRLDFQQAHVTQSFINWYRTYVDRRGVPVFGRHGIVNCLDVDHAGDVATEINEALGKDFPEGILPAIAITSDTPKGLRKWAIEQYKAGKVMMLTGVDVFIHGFHATNTHWVFNIDPSMSGVKVGQRGGRARSKDRSGKDPDKIAIIGEILYENTSPYGWQLLYAEWAKRRMFQTTGQFPHIANFWGQAEKKDAANDPGTGAKFNWEKVAADTVIDDPHEVMSLINWRAQRLRELRPRPHWTTRFPKLWPVMNEKGLYSGLDLYEAMRAIDPEFAIGRLQTILAGKVDHFHPDRYLDNWNPTCLLASKALGRHVSDLFPVPADWGDKPRLASPEQRDYLAYRERFRNHAERAGFSTLRDLAKHLDLTQNGLSNIIKKRTANFTRTGNWNEGAQQIAQALMLRPEQLFGVPDRMKVVHNAWQAFAKAGPAHLPELSDITTYTQDQTSEQEREQARKDLDRLMLRVLPPRVHFVMAHRLGLRVEEATFEEIGQKVGLTSQRIRQLEVKGISLLSHQAHKKELEKIWRVLRPGS